MVLRPRTRQLLRRAVVTAALGALVVPATAGAAAKTPVIKKVTPRAASVGTKLTIQGKNFRRGKGKNSVLFRRNKGKALFVKADVSTTKRLTVIVPKTLEKFMVQEKGKPVPTRFHLRVMTTRLSKEYKANALSPVIGPERAKGDGDNSGGAGVPTVPDGDCDGDGVKNGVDGDDDNDLMSDALELALLLDPCVIDTDGDRVEDGFEYQSAIDLNNDDYQSPNASLPYPGKTPYPNPLFDDSNSDHDGDGLTLADEYALWKYTYQVNHTAARTLSPLSYSDGTKFSLSTLAGGNGVRQPSMPVASYTPPQTFRAWADAFGYGNIPLYPLVAPPAHDTRSSFDLYDMNRSGGVSNTAVFPQQTSERFYWNLDDDQWVADDERDEDADGLTNYDETHGPLTSGWWAGCYSNEGSYPITYAGTKAFDADSDGDGVLDGADDNDFDDVPNIMERSRNMAGGGTVEGMCGGSVASPHGVPVQGRVQPFNPCLPDIWSRTCQKHPQFSAPYPPYQQGWVPVVLN